MNWMGHLKSLRVCILRQRTTSLSPRTCRRIQAQVKWHGYGNTNYSYFSTFTFTQFIRKYATSSTVQSEPKSIMYERTEELDLNKFIAALERVPRQTFGRTFLQALVEHMVRFPQKLSRVSWPEIIRHCTEMDRSIDERNFGGILFQFCSRINDISVAENYLKWDKNPSLSVLTLHIRTLADKDFPDVESRILELYETIKSKNRDVWDFQSGERVIPALTKTQKWKDSLAIINKMEVGGIVPTSCYSFVASAAFDRKEIELGWSIFQNNVKHYRISDQPFVSYLRNVEPTEENVVKLLTFMDLCEHFSTEATIQSLRSIFENSLGYTGIVSNILPSKGSCISCGTQLEKNALSPEEYRRLLDSFLNKVLQDEDIFLNTTPEELKHFRHFIASKGPFDYVLDGLNIGFAQSGGHNPAVSAENLQLLVEQFSRQGSRVLVIGRRHMLRWPKRNLQAIEKCANMYLINNNSNDDPFIIYATLKSNSTAKFVSKDMMRNHTFRLGDPVLARLFKRWRLSQQLTIEKDSRGRFSRPVPFTPILPVPQKNLQSGIWHIPYEPDRLHSPYDIPSKWLCLQPKKLNKKN